LPESVYFIGFSDDFGRKFWNEMEWNLLIIVEIFVEFENVQCLQGFEMIFLMDFTILKIGKWQKAIKNNGLPNHVSN